MEKERKKEEEEEKEKEKGDEGKGSEEVVFKRKGRKKSLRQKPKVEEEEGEEEETDVGSVLEQTKKRQQLRTRPIGLDASETLNSFGKVELEEEEAVGLDAQFTGATSTAPVDQLLQQFLDQQMGKQKSSSSAPSESLDIHKRKVDQLYQLPTNLIPKENQKEEEESEPVILTNIPEVELSIDYKIKNIEETEKARRDLERQRAERTSREGDVPRNFNSNFSGRYSHHKRPNPSKDDQHEAKRRKEDVSSDDVAVQRFKRQMRY